MASLARSQVGVVISTTSSARNSAMGHLLRDLREGAKVGLDTVQVRRAVVDDEVGDARVGVRAQVGSDIVLRAVQRPLGARRPTRATEADAAAQNHPAGGGQR